MIIGLCRPVIISCVNFLSLNYRIISFHMIQGKLIADALKVAMKHLEEYPDEFANLCDVIIPEEEEANKNDSGSGRSKEANSMDPDNAPEAQKISLVNSEGTDLRRKLCVKMMLGLGPRQSQAAESHSADRSSGKGTPPRIGAPKHDENDGLHTSADSRLNSEALATAGELEDDCPHPMLRMRKPFSFEDSENFEGPNVLEDLMNFQPSTSLPPAPLSPLSSSNPSVSVGSSSSQSSDQSFDSASSTQTPASLVNAVNSLKIETDSSAQQPVVVTPIKSPRKKKTKSKTLGSSVKSRKPNLLLVEDVKVSQKLGQAALKRAHYRVIILV